jgi:hypothetical protein
MRGKVDAGLPNDNTVPKHWIYAPGGESVEARRVLSPVGVGCSRFSMTTSNVSERASMNEKFVGNLGLSDDLYSADQAALSR